MTGALLAGAAVSPSAAVVVATARAMADRNGVEERTAREAARRLLSGDYRRWQAQARGAGFCSRPVRVSGGRSVLGADGRRELYCTDGEPDRVLLIRCGNRRASVCAPCSREYKGDVWHLLHAGTAGGSKGVPESVATHPMWFLTLTGPGFGAVHGAGCGRGGPGRSASGDRACSAQVRCAHGRPRVCGLVHGEDDPMLGEALCPDCYDYSGSVAFNWAAPELWRRFTIALRRRLAGRVGISEAELGRRVRVSYAKVAEFQRRGVVHFHAIIRLDGAGDGHPPARIGLGEPEIAAVIRAAVGDVAVTAPTGAVRSAVLRFGGQVDVRAIAPVAGADEAGGVSAGMVAAYIAKYATKAAEDFGLDSTVRTSSMARAAGLRPHTVAMILAAEELAGLEHYAGMARWLHMLGFRGHFTTKSRHFSVTLGALRQARRDYRADHRQPAGPVDGQAPDVSGAGGTPDPAGTHPVLASVTVPGPPADEGSSEVTEVVGDWRFLGLGYTTAGDALLAAHAYADHLVDRSLAREAARQ